MCQIVPLNVPSGSLAAERADNFDVGRPFELIDRDGPYQTVTARNKQGGIAREARRVAADRDDDRYLACGKHAGLGFGPGPWRIEDDAVEAVEFAGM